jgi:thymidylate synthase (FAD)
MNVKLVWATPNIDMHLAYIARVSNPSNQDNPDVEKLLRYMLKNGHVSPFEMASVCIEINTTRDIGRQILRHRSFSFQEFSQRYADASDMNTATMRECRLQDKKNRQSSLTADDDELKEWWFGAQALVSRKAFEIYDQALSKGIAKEQARAILPEGLTGTRMYMSGTVRSWIHYLNSRLDTSTQKEHRELAEEIFMILKAVAPVTFSII